MGAEELTADSSDDTDLVGRTCRAGFPRRSLPRRMELKKTGSEIQLRKERNTLRPRSNNRAAAVWVLIRDIRVIRASFIMLLGPLAAGAIALGIGFEFGRRVLWQPMGELIPDRLMLWGIGEVAEFIRIVGVIVEFLCSVCIGDQAPVSSADGVIAKVGRGDRRSLAGGCWIVQLRSQ